MRTTFPADYGNPDMAGKEAVFEVTVKEVRHRLPAAIDDTLAEAVGLENLGELRQEIRQRMQRDYEGIARQRLKRMLLDKLAEGYDFPVPPGMVEMEFNSIWSQYEGEKEARKQIAARAAESQAGGEGPVDAAALIAPEETALEGASERAPAERRGRQSRKGTRRDRRGTTRSRTPARPKSRSTPPRSSRRRRPRSKAPRTASRPPPRTRTTRRPAPSSSGSPSGGSGWGCCLPRSAATTILRSARKR